MKKMTKWVVFATVLLIFSAVSFLTMEAPQMIDWGHYRAVVFESDDWGLAGFVPSSKVWEGVSREELIPGNFPAVYWESTLEDSLMVHDLCSIMASVVGADGLPAVFQPNYVLSSLSYEKEASGWYWRRYDLPDLPPVYRRPGMWTAVQEGIQKGLWYPEFHATWHYDPAMRLESAVESPLARRMTKAGVTLFPHSEKARELGPWRSAGDLYSEFYQSASLFQKIFQRSPTSIIAPDYTWNGRIERMWQSRGVMVIQGKREQRNPSLPGGMFGRILKVLERKWAILDNNGRVYLERNCRLEPVQAPDAEAVVAACVRDTRKAWQRNQPAIVETHRVNFAHTDESVVRIGQDSMKKYLNTICSDPELLPHFLVDSEVAQLEGRGVSWVFRGNKLILRNATHSRRIIGVTHNFETKWYILNGNSVVVTVW